jgi:hypothetical protein
MSVYISKTPSMQEKTPNGVLGTVNCSIKGSKRDLLHHIIIGDTFLLQANTVLSFNILQEGRSGRKAKAGAG